MAPAVLVAPRGPTQEEVLLSTDSVRPETRSGDPFAAAGLAQDHPHACLDGWIYLSYTVFDEAVGEEVERVEALPCRRCAEAGSV